MIQDGRKEQNFGTAKCGFHLGGTCYCDQLSGFSGQGAGSIGVVFIGAMVIACLLNMTTVASLSELNALMPNTTGGLAQYTLACMGPFPTLISMVGGYLICNVMYIRC